ncbi:MAG: hypothetical protein IPG85_13275 [Bacteroidetes bacterium]|nr:hypothetical protein [Bacteroidota bacterium]
MVIKIISLFIIVILNIATITVNAQASLTIENNSMRTMSVKVMKGSSGKGTLHDKVTIGAYGRKTIYFSTSGYYFTKTKAVLAGKDPVYRKGNPFSVTNDDTGYSVMTLTFFY